MLETRPDMKILLMSGYEISGLAETGWPFIAKPFGLNQLLERARDALEGRAYPDSPFDRRLRLTHQEDSTQCAPYYDCPALRWAA